MRSPYNQFKWIFKLGQWDGNIDLCYRIERTVVINYSR